MKPLRSLASIRSVGKRKIQLPLIKSKKDIIKVSNLSVDQTTQIILNIRIFPVQIVIFNPKDGQRTLVYTHNEIKIQSSKTTKSIPIFANGYKWIQLVFPLPIEIVKTNIAPYESNSINTFIKTNIFHSVQNWLSYSGQTIKSLYSINLSQNQTNQRISQNSAIPKESEHVEVKKFVNNIMSKKITQKLYNSKYGNKCQQTHSIIHKDPLLNKTVGKKYSISRQPDSQISMRQRVSGGLRFIDTSKHLKESVFTGKSERQTSIGGDKSTLTRDKSIIRDENKKQTNWTMDIDEKQYSRRLLKFDSTKVKDMFNPPSSTQINFNVKNWINSNSISFKHPQFDRQQLEKQVEAEVEVQEDIQIVENNEIKKTIDRESDTFEGAFKKEKEQQQKCQRQNLDQSGSIYQSKYQ